ncbi:uncharacterized protein BX663DRAFT_160248 [Cokeromyces recurvatus]|uniref:uncharacterized protein n=1 Tax=Cokeromyces recurvatus TaxID=90255 RepID=UPI00222084F1|nr:uncharacterized protein BX663DRAFT_160248 [Cokeromyces recurvatus]KAI7900243.1 hypothetical protein BX663DRAFT_160248 [Cokeromyces recurvatus]
MSKDYEHHQQQDDDDDNWVMSHFQNNSYIDDCNGVHDAVVKVIQDYRAPLPQPFQLPSRQATIQDTISISNRKKNCPIKHHLRRASEQVERFKLDYLLPYQPMTGFNQLTVSQHDDDTNTAIQKKMYISEPDEDPMQHLVLLPLGKTGAGKSSLLNLMLGDNAAFKAKAGARSVTDCVTERTGIWAIDQVETIITVADTPGFADRSRLGIDSFMLVFQYDSPTNNIMSILEHFDYMMQQQFQYCNKSWWDHVLLVFTRVDYYPNLKFPPNMISKKQSIIEVLVPSIQEKFNLSTPPKYAFVSSKAPNCSFSKKGKCDCFAASKYHLDQMRTLRIRINSILSGNGKRWMPTEY